MDMTMAEADSRRVVSLCKEQDLTLDVVIRKTNAAPTAVAMLIQGNEDLLRKDLILNICEALNVTLEEFFDADLFNGFQDAVRQWCAGDVE